MRTGNHWSVWCQLEPGQGFYADTPTGRIRVRQIRLTDYGWKRNIVHITGPAVKKDGTFAMFERQGEMPFDELPNAVKDGLSDAMDELAAVVEESTPVV